MRGTIAAVALLAALAFGAPSAHAASCGVADSALWIDYAGHDAPVPAEPGTVLAVSSGTEVPAQMRAQGAATIFFDLHFNDRVGTPAAPADPATIADRAKRLYDFAVQVTGCPTPVIAENELFGAQTPTPWSPGNARYRANTLALLQDLAALGARPALTIANPPYTGGDAADWWRQVAQVAILVRQVYFTSPNAKGLYALGPAAASRAMRQGLRHLVTHLTQIGIPAGRVALELQFQSAPGLGARAGLQPRRAWLEVVKLQALAAKQVLREYRLQGIWSWGFATFSAEGQDPDKPAAACVWLWARDPKLCDGPAAAGPGFDASLTEGQLQLPPGIRCRLDAGDITQNAIYELARVTGDADYAASVLLERLVLRQAEPVADPRAARGRIEARFRPRSPSAQDVADFRSTYAQQQIRLVQTDAPAPWLDGAQRGFAVATLAPAGLFRLHRPAKLTTPDGAFRVEPLGPPRPLASFAAAQQEAAARTALGQIRRASLYGSWLRAAEQRALRSAVCLRDDLPEVGATRFD